MKQTCARLKRRLQLGLLPKILLATLLAGLLPLGLVSYTALQATETASARATKAATEGLDNKALEAFQIEAQDTADRITQMLDATVQSTRAAALLPRTAESYQAFYAAHQGELWYQVQNGGKVEDRRE